MSKPRRRRAGDPTAGGHIKPRRTVVDGYTFPSLEEAKRYGALKLRLSAVNEKDRIWDLEVHPKFPIKINGRKIGRGWMELDFGYKCWRDGAIRQVYEQFKGDWDDPFQHWKNQVCAALHNITIIEVRL